MEHQFLHLIIVRLVLQPKCELTRNEYSMYINDFYVTALKMYRGRSSFSSQFPSSICKRESLKFPAFLYNSHHTKSYDQFHIAEQFCHQNCIELGYSLNACKIFSWENQLPLFKHQDAHCEPPGQQSKSKDISLA